MNIYNSKYLNSRYFLIFILFCFTYVLVAQSDNYFRWIHPKKLPPEHYLTIQTDGSGYYAYLPKWFIYKNDKDFSFIEGISKKYKNSSFIYSLNYDNRKHKGTDKYYVGTAICSIPVFLISHYINILANGEGDGYSRSYQFTVSLNAIFFWFIGILALIKLFKFWKINNFSIICLISILTFGTNLNFYTVYFPSYSHVFSFGTISWFIYIGFKWGQIKSPIQFLKLCVLLGLIFSIRPTNIIIILFIPFFFSDWKSFVITLKDYLFNRYIYLIFGIITFFCFVFIQLINVYDQVGKWSLNTYSKEHFDFLFNPQFYNVLFSYKKGFFIYSPIMFIIFLSFSSFFKSNRYQFFGWFFVSFSFLFLTSSWWCWWYGGGLGMRPFIDVFSILILPIAIMFKKVNELKRFFVLILSVIFIYVYQIYQIQYNKNIIHYDLMNKEIFWRVFMKTDMRYSWCAIFKDEHLPQLKANSVLSFKYQSSTNNFQKVNRISLDNRILKSVFSDPKFTFIPKLEWDKDNIGIRISGKINITQQESNPSIDVFYFNNGKEIKKASALLGYRVPNLNESTKFQVEFNPQLFYKDIDSIRINIGRGVQPTSYKSIQLKFYNFSRK